MSFQRVTRLRTCDARFSICMSSTLPPRITHGVYHILRSGACLCHGHRSGSYISQCRDRPRYPSAISVRRFSHWASSWSEPLIDSRSQISCRQAEEPTCSRIFHEQKGAKSRRGSSVATRNQSRLRSKRCGLPCVVRDMFFLVILRSGEILSFF